MVVPEQSSEALAAANAACSLADRCLGEEQSVVHALVIPFAVVVQLVLGEGSPQRPLAEEDDPGEAITLYRTYPPLRDSIEIWRTRGGA